MGFFCLPAVWEYSRFLPVALWKGDFGVLNVGSRREVAFWEEVGAGSCGNWVCIPEVSSVPLSCRFHHLNTKRMDRLHGEGGQEWTI